MLLLWLCEWKNKHIYIYKYNNKLDAQWMGAKWGAETSWNVSRQLRLHIRLWQINKPYRHQATKHQELLNALGTSLNLATGSVGTSTAIGVAVLILVDPLRYKPIKIP